MMSLFKSRLDKHTTAQMRGDDLSGEVPEAYQIQNVFTKGQQEITDEATFRKKQRYVADGLADKNKGPIAEIWEQVQALWRYVASDKVPWVKKVAPLAALVYLVSPIDLVPDFIPVAGLLDDAGVIGFAIGSLGSVLNDYRKDKGVCL